MRPLGDRKDDLEDAGAAIALVAGLGSATADEPFTYLEGVRATAMTDEPAATELYEVYRCNFAHTLGLDTYKVGGRTEFRGTAYPIVVSKGFPLDNAKMAELESIKRPGWLPGTLGQEPAKLVLRVDALYWGARKMVHALTADHASRAVADTFLNDRGYGEIQRSSTGEFVVDPQSLKIK